MEKKPSSRNNNLDAVRGIAILLVVFTHVHELLKFRGFSQNLFYSIDRLGVPLFFFLIGVFSLNKAAKNPVKFLFPRIIQFTILLLFWTFLTAIIVLMLRNGFNLSQALNKWFYSFNAVNPAKYIGSQFWFMYAIIPVYVLLPLCAKSIEDMSAKILFIMIILIFLFSFSKAYPLSEFTKGTLLMRMQLDGNFKYILYIMLGNFLLLKLRVNGIYFITGVFLFIVSVFIMNYSAYQYETLPKGFFWYTGNVFIISGSAGLLMIIKSSNIQSKYLTLLSKYSFGIYMCHYILLYLIHYSYIEIIDDKNIWVQLILYFLLTTLFSLVFCYILEKIIPRFKWLFR